MKAFQRKQWDVKQGTRRKHILPKHENEFSRAESTTRFKCYGKYASVRTLFHKKVSNGQVYDKVGRTALA